MTINFEVTYPVADADICDRLPIEMLEDTGYEDGRVWWPCDRDNPNVQRVPDSRRLEKWPDGGVCYWRADRSVEIVLPGSIRHALTNILQRRGRWYISGASGYHSVQWERGEWHYRYVNSLPSDEERGLCG